MNVQKFLSPVQELVMSLHERLAISKLLRVFYDLIEHWLILGELLLSCMIVLPFHHVLDGLSFVLIFFIVWDSSLLPDVLIK